MLSSVDNQLFGIFQWYIFLLLHPSTIKIHIIPLHQLLLCFFYFLNTFQSEWI